MASDRYERERRELEKAYGDAVYEAWRRGLDSDAVSRESVNDFYYENYDASLAAQKEVARLQRERDRRDERRRMESEETTEEESDHGN